ncbi:MAG: UDP-N-acetylmuramoyl-L-alanine--D-glutamate ligase, partial [Bryobacteraceae bacterium]
QGATVIATDERPADSLLPYTEETFGQAELIVLSPGVPADLPLLNKPRKTGTPILGEVELASYFLKGPVIGITGSNGKTTTTAMIGHILMEAGIDCQLGGNIGTAPTAMVADSREEQWNVLELSSFQLETIDEFRAQISVCMNVTPDHLDRHHSFQNYSDAKARLFETQEAEDYAVLNADDRACVGFASRSRAKVFWFSATRPVTPGLWLNAGTLICDGVPLLRVDEIPLRGMHNVENTMAAASACRLAGASLQAIGAGVRSFPGVPHRLEFIREYNGVQYFNDSKATNIDATLKAIDAFPGGLWIILGGKDKDSDYAPLREKLRTKARRVLLIGAAADKIAAQLEGLPLIPAGTMENAIGIASSQAKSGDVVLLAPACASFDQFENYEHRGRVFSEAVRSL